MHSSRTPRQQKNAPRTRQPPLPRLPGSGVGAELMARTSGAAKRRWGFAAYVVQTASLLWTARPSPFRITVDGTVVNLEATSVLVANCREFVPPWFSLAPDIAIDDGVLDVIVMRARGLTQSAWVLGRLALGAIDGDSIRHMRGREISVHADPQRPVELDGEVAGVTPFTASIVPGALSVLVPAFQG